jgi:hypothetical protein
MSATVAVVAIAPAFAEEDRFSLHGFGNQDYWKSTANSINGSGGPGAWDNNFLGLVMSAKVSDRSKVWAQVQANSRQNVRFTWMFVDYAFSDDLRGQVGRIKFPQGIYNEYIDTRALQVAATKPLAYSLEADLNYDALNGVALTYDLSLNRSGRLQIQVFGGNLFNPSEVSASAPYPAQFQLDNLEAATEDHHVFGGMLTWETPVDGLRVLVSGNRTKIASTADNGQIPNQQGEEDRLMLSVDYVREYLDLKAEYNYHLYPGLSGFKDLRSHAWYVQAGFPIGKWMPYGRYDSLVSDTDQSSDPSFYQRTFVIGVNRKLSTNLNFRIEDHFNHGYALPVAAGETQIDKGRTNWQLFVASINFMF